MNQFLIAINKTRKNKLKNSYTVNESNKTIRKKANSIFLKKQKQLLIV